MKSLTLGLVASVNHLDLDDSDDIPLATKVLVKTNQVINYDLTDTLDAITARGPLNDGDVPSKASRDVLLELGLIEKVVVKGEDGFQATNYLGFKVWKTLKSIYNKE